MLQGNIFSKRLLLTAVSAVMFAMGTSTLVLADTPAELLAKAIYTEETVGDLDKAIGEYQSVLVASGPAIDAAAEAQYRIGACFAKQGKTAEAKKAYQAVMDGYVASKVWVKQAEEQLASFSALQPVPWGDGDEMHMRMKLPGGLDAGFQVFRVAKTKVDGKDYWECQAWQTIILNDAMGKSRVLADFDSFAAVESEWTHTMLGEATAEYSDSEVAVSLAGKKKPKVLTLGPMTYDNEQAAEVFRRLPLAEGYKGEINVIGSLTQAKVPIGLEVTGVETVEVPAGKFECFKLKLSIGQTFWISTSDKREIVRFEVSGVEANLIEVRKADSAPTTIGGDKFSMTLPLGWYGFDSDDVTFLLDPDNSMRSQIAQVAIEEAKEKADSPEAGLKSKIDKIKKAHKNVTAKESDVKTLSIAGHKAAMLDYDYNDDKAPKHVRILSVFGSKTALELIFKMSADQKDKQLPKIQKLIDSLKLK